MTNLERLNAMNDEEYKLAQLEYENCTVKPFIDYEAWLKSDAEEYPIIGKQAVLNEEDGSKVECVLVGTSKKQQEEYARLVVKLPGLHNFKSIFVPLSKVTVLSQVKG